MNEFDFVVLRNAWDKFRTDREDEIKKLSPSFVSPGEIYLKRIQEDDNYLTVEFLGFENSVDDAGRVQQAKRIIVNWVKRFSMDVQIQRSDPNTLILRISKELKFSESQDVDEAAVSIFKRDPKTNKTKKAYRCIGGKKNGRRVSNPDDCIGVPDWNKKMNMQVSKRAKYGQSAAAKTKTKLTNIVAKRVSKANKRLKKARGF